MKINQNEVIGIIAVTLFFFILGGLIVTQHYFHSKEIESLTLKCDAAGGIPDLEITNKITNHYIFHCNHNIEGNDE